MNRAQRRAIVKTNTNVYTENEMKEIMRQTQHKTFLTAYDLYVEVFKMALKDTYGFADVRQQRVFDKVNSIFNALEKKDLTFDEIKEAMQQELKKLVVR